MHLEAVQVLLNYNADINSQTLSGYTALHWVLKFRNESEEFTSMVRRLLEHGADPNICNNDHTTPLHEASSYGLLDAARLLLSHGAKVDEKDGSGKTPLQVVASKRHDEMVKLLVAHGAVHLSQ